jgi:hypothetical protein
MKPKESPNKYTSPTPNIPTSSPGLLYPFPPNFLSPALDSFHHAVVRSFFPFPPPPPLPSVESDAKPYDGRPRFDLTNSLFHYHPHQPPFPFYPRLFEPTNVTTKTQEDTDDQSAKAPVDLTFNSTSSSSSTNVTPTKFSSIPALCASSCTECSPNNSSENSNGSAAIKRPIAFLLVNSPSEERFNAVI